MTVIVLGFFDLLKGVAWQAVLLLIALGYKLELLSFLPKFLALLLRSRKVKIADVVELEVDAAEQQQRAGDLVKVDSGSGTVTLSDSGIVTLKAIPGLVRTAAITRLELDLHEKLKGITPGTEPVDVLVRNLAQARLEAAFGFIYAGIFGSQIMGLISLEARRKVPNDEAHKYFLQVERKFPEVYTDYGFAGWLGFLKNHGLIVQIGDDVAITDFGDDFLRWLRETRLSISKPY